MSGGLDETLCTLAFCWRIERRDGVAIGLTSHDRDLEIGGLIYRAAPGMTPAAVRSGITLEGEDSDVAGALSSDAISEADLAAGRWDGAALELRLTQWEAPGETWLLLARGEIGAVSRKGQEFSAELIDARLPRAAGRHSVPGRHGGATEDRRGDQRRRHARDGGWAGNGRAGGGRLCLWHAALDDRRQCRADAGDPGQ